MRRLTIAALALTASVVTASPVGRVAVAQCVINANESMPVGKALTRAIKACYTILPPAIRASAYKVGIAVQAPCACAAHTSMLPSETHTKWPLPPAHATHNEYTHAHSY